MCLICDNPDHNEDDCPFYDELFEGSQVTNLNGRTGETEETG